MSIPPKRDLGPQPDDLVPSGPYASGQWVAYAIGVVLVIALLLIALLSDNYFSPIVAGSLIGGTIVGFFLWHKSRQDISAAPRSAPNRSLANDHEYSKPMNLRPKDVWMPEPKHLVPFGPYGGGQWTAHPIGLVIVIGLVLMGLVSRTPVSILLLFSLLGGAIVGFFLWLHQR